MNQNNKGIMYLLGSVICGFMMARKIPVLLQSIPQIPEPVATGQVTGISIGLIVSAIFAVYGLVLVIKNNSNNKNENTPPSPPSV